MKNIGFGVSSVENHPRGTFTVRRCGDSFELLRWNGAGGYDILATAARARYLTWPGKPPPKKRAPSGPGVRG